MDAAVDGAAVSELERRVMATVKASEQRRDPPLIRALEVGRCAREMGLSLPHPELDRVLVSNLCFSHHTPDLWKLLDQALASSVVSPFHTLALLTARIIPHRRTQPGAYRLYLELLGRYALSSCPVEPGSSRDRITESVDDALQLSHTYGIYRMDFGHAVVLFVLKVITSVIDATLEDCGWRLSTDKHGNIDPTEGHQLMDISAKGNSEDKRHDHRDGLRRSNTLMALEAVEKIISNKKGTVFLRLAHLNMPEKFSTLLQRLQFIESHKSISRSLVSANHVMTKLLENIFVKAMDGEYQLNKHELLGFLVDSGPCGSDSCHTSGAGRAACWISFDIFLEHAMDGKSLHAISSAEILTELIKTLQIINQASWQETFQSLWISALRLIQREREPSEGPIPHLDARLCMLLSIVPLAVIPLIKENATATTINKDLSGNVTARYEQRIEGNKLASRRHGWISSLQVLGQFSGLLAPPPSVVNAANTAATKAATFVSRLKTGNGNMFGHNDTSVKAVGNMLHLIVEACIARRLIDTSAYLWPGYVVPSAPSNDSVLVQESPWSDFMEGAQLTDSLTNALMATPASSITELEKLYHLALNGSEEHRSAAAKILCGASLNRGWNIQEYVVDIVIKLLSPHVPPGFSGLEAESHLISYMSMLSAILVGLSCIDAVHILSLYGMVPEVAAALMPLCEVFGSLSPPSDYRSGIFDEISAYAVFSRAFLFLLRLWKFYKPPQEHCIAGRGGTVRLELTLDYLLLLRNSRIAFKNSMNMNMTNYPDSLDSVPAQLVYIDTFPKLRAWYFQNQACIASTLSGLCNKNPVHQVAHKILNMIYQKMAKVVGTVSGNSPSGSSRGISGSPVNTTDDADQRPALPAWEILEAVPFVLEAVLTACEHGSLSSRDLTTGLRDLVDFLPASLATIVSYFSAEITRGIWKPVAMNGTDWPSPGDNLSAIDSEIKEILLSAGVHLPKNFPSGVTPMLPLPMAALVSLTITFKVDKSLGYVHGVVGQALENCTRGCSWPSISIIGALWTQKVRRWHDFIVLSCARSPFTQDKDAICQLIQSCFSAFLGTTLDDGSHITANRGVNALIGETISDQGFHLPVAPGFLYLRTCRTFHDTHFVSNTILRIVIEAAVKLASESFSDGPACLRSGRVSLAAAVAGARDAARLGASLLCVAGGIQLVQVLYEETLPTCLMVGREREQSGSDLVSHIIEGCAMAYMLILSGAFVWGTGSSSEAYTSVFSSRRARIIGMHLDFVAKAVDGNVYIGCNPSTWKTYVSCLVGLLLSFVPEWLPEMKQQTLWKLASGLKALNESGLALSLLEHSGPAAMTSIAESILSSQ